MGIAVQNVRSNIDVSLPPPPLAACAGRAAARAAVEPLQQKRYLLSWKGSLAKSALARRLAALYGRRESQDVVIVDESDSHHSDEDIRFSSVFALVVGDGETATSGFSEAVCSGGIPVLAADNWAIPFEDSAPFVSYGVQVGSSDEALEGLVEKLREMQSDDAVQNLRQANARKACSLHFQTLEQQAVSLASELVYPPIGALNKTYISAVISDGVVYAVLHNNMVYSSVSRSGRTLSGHIWNLHSKGDVTQIAVDDGVVFALGLQGAIYRQSLQLMTPESSWTKVSPGPVRSIDANAGKVYVVGQNYKVYVFDVAGISRQEPWTLVADGSVDAISVVADAIYARGSRNGRIYKKPLEALGSQAPWQKTPLERLPRDVRALV